MGKNNWKRKAQVKPSWIPDRRVPASPPTGDHVTVRLSFEYCDPGGSYCLSQCADDDVRHAVDCFRRLTSLTWVQVYGTATKDKSSKTGLHWHPYDDDSLRVKRPSQMSQDHRIHGIRAGGKYRIFGFRFGSYFHVLWFDPEHEICPDG